MSVDYNDVLTFTLVDELTEEEKPIRMVVGKLGERIILKLPNNHDVVVSTQQLAELGSLFVSIANCQYDNDSIDELLDGSDLPNVFISSEVF